MIFLGGIACILIGSYVGYYFGDRAATPPPPSWKSIPLPNGVQPDHFIASLTPFAHVVATNGEIYYNPCFSGMKTWTEGEIKNGLGGSCGLYSIDGFWQTDFPDLPQTRKGQSYCLLTGDTYMGPPNLAKACLYVILDNGEIVRWDTVAWLRSETRPVPTHSTSYTETVTIFGASGGVIGALVFYIFVMIAISPKRS